jgi:glutaconate CoA-transferase, subunit A
LTVSTRSPRRTPVVTTEAEALAELEDGMTIVLGGFANSGHPMSLIREVIRSGKRELTIMGAATSSLEVDMLIAAGVTRKVISPYVGGETIVGIGPVFQRAAQRGEVEVWEIDEAMYYCALNAAAQQLPFLPWRGLVGTSFPEVNTDLKVFDDPIRGEPLLAVPAIAPDFALLHASAADMYGNVQHIGSGFGDRAMARAADRTVVSVEKVISNEELRRFPERTSIPLVDAVVRAPFGAHPFSSPGCYLEDREHIRELVEAGRSHARAGDRTAFEAYLDRYVRRPERHVDYLEAVGLRRLLSLHEY